MKSPKDQRIIQIDITNACVNKCSNCTRFCGHHKKPFFMDFETFKKAVDSLEGFEGMVGIIGGEPTIHPEFEKFAEYIGKKRLKHKFISIKKPLKEILPFVQKNLMSVEGNSCGLWSTLGRSYYKHFEVINDSFDSQFLNDHNNTCMHQALLMSRKDYGLTDEEWIPQRDACWIQNLWSATITPKGAFFCEVAGALDMLFNGPGGWEVTKDWWKREPKDFGDQLHWCELCSCGYDVPKRLSNDGRDDVSPTVYQMLLDVDSPKAKAGLCVVHTKEDYLKHKNNYKAFTGNVDYMEQNHSKRLSDDNNSIKPREIKVCTEENLSDTLNNSKDWVAVTTEKHKRKAEKLSKKLFKNSVINLGCLYTYEDDIYLFNVNAKSIKNNIDKITTIQDIINCYPEDKKIKFEIYNCGCNSKILRLFNLIKIINQ